MKVKYSVNNVYKSRNLEERKEKFNKILNKLIYILEQLESEY